MPDTLTFAGFVALVLHGIGVLSALHVVMRGRTPQGTIAWILFLIMLPYFAVVMYWLFGRRRFQGYIDVRRATEGPLHELALDLQEKASEHVAELPAKLSRLQVLERLVRLPITSGNDARLLIDGEATFDRIFEAIEGARASISLQFFVVRYDRIGRQLLERLVERARAGVEVRFLYDTFGSIMLRTSFLRALRDAGVRIEPFRSARFSINRFQVNFRNHRKLVVVDGELGFVGGVNVGDEYVDGGDEFEEWRDTFLELRGPAVQGLQLSFAEDWQWATGDLPRLDWSFPPADPAGRLGLVLPTGPADPHETCSLVFTSLLHAAQERIWIATPYFVPDSQVLGALQLAGLRGVDVRILLPSHSDHRFVYLAGWSFHEDVLECGVRIFRYRPGFQHQKVVLVDDDVAMVGTANLDNRSLRLNFEIGVLLFDRDFAARVEPMLERDFERSDEMQLWTLARRSHAFRFGARFARLFAPIL